MKIFYADESKSYLSEASEPCTITELIAANRVLEKVRRDGDSALNVLARDFGEGKVESFSETDLRPYWERLPLATRKALQVSVDNVRRTHETELAVSEKVILNPDVQISKKIIPLSKVGVYVPNGVAPLPSSLIMGTTPAKVAGVKQIVAAFAGGMSGPNPILMGAAFAAGVNQVVTVGGAQAIAALAVGTQTVPKVDFICGPGGRRVTAAKALVSALGLAGIDMLAGPSEVCIISDGSVPLLWTAADLLSQLEHGTTSLGYLIVTSEEMALEVDSILRRLILEKNFSASSEQVRAIIVKDSLEAIEVANSLAPEHLLIQTENADLLAGFVVSAGSIFLGGYSSESLGDYASGTNHILPTSGQARVRGGLSVFDFLKRISVQKVSARGAELLAPTVELLAGQENLRAHEFASAVRRL